MKRNTIYFVDEDPPARRANVQALAALLGGEVTVLGVEPLKGLSDYNKLMAQPATAAFFLDQRMKQSGLVSYNGTELAEHLRSIDSKIPLYILTGYADKVDDFRGKTARVEAIIPKHEIEDPDTDEARTHRARILRHLDIFNDIRSDRADRFHALLVKSLHTPLSIDEQVEIDLIEGDIGAPLVAAERADARQLGMLIEEIKKVVSPDGI